MHVKGTYFGDNDVLLNNGKNGRDTTSIAETECQLLVLTKFFLVDILKKFPVYRREMKQVASRRQNHHNAQIKKINLRFEEEAKKFALKVEVEPHE